MILPGWKELSHEEIIENINYGHSLLNRSPEEMERLYKEACHRPPMPFIIPREDYEKDRLRFAFPELHEKIRQERPGVTKEQEDFAKACKVIWNGMKKITQVFTESAYNKMHTQWTLEELQKAVQKHPNRIDLKLELMKLQKQNKTSYIGRPKRKKRK
jgi:hypothetical protein